MALLDRLWRRLATALAFALFALGALTLSVLCFPLLGLIPGKAGAERERRFRQLISRSFRCYLTLLSALGVIKFKITLNDRKVQPGWLYLANHPTLLDYVVLTALFPELTCMVKGSLLTNPFIGGVIKKAGYISNELDNVSLLDECARRLQAGQSLLIFPEGTRSGPQGLNPLKRGAANIALRCRCPVRFIKLKVSEPLLTKEVKWHQVPQRRPCYEVCEGDSLPYAAFACASAEELPHAVRQLTQTFAAKLSA